jgi:hypothetical protein
MFSMAEDDAMDDVTERIRDRAYQIWLDEGQPTGRERAHWEQAARELGLDQPSSSERADERVDEGLEETFPTSDTPSEIQPGGGITGP